jgi:TonB family protein
MKAGISISVIGHLCLISISMILTLKPAPAWQSQLVYKIELLRIPPESSATLTTSNSGNKNMKTSESEALLIKNIETHTSKENMDLLTEQALNLNRKPANIQLNATDFPFSYYLQIREHRIKQNWEPPYEAIGNDSKRLAIIRFQVLKNGQIDNIDLITQSGKILFDQAAKRSILNTRNLPPLPETYPNDCLTVLVEFEVIK